ncbi:MAG TPA: ribosome silencing factor [Verrucomicrobiota bacterium]|nr:ribosome silencing factor [Verrucomicrobiota bacterium]HNT14280.1 ribosome silencing factor [Verrucomicrobiota bacterium]
MDAKKLALLCRACADNKKAENLLVLDVRKLSNVTDYFVIATGTSAPHLRAIVEEIVDHLRTEHGRRPHARDGSANANWVVLDYFDVIVHVMRTDVREHYDLEGLWGDAPVVRPPAVRKSRARQSAARPGPRKRTTRT